MKLIYLVEARRKSDSLRKANAEGVVACLPSGLMLIGLTVLG